MSSPTINRARFTRRTAAVLALGAALAVTAVPVTAGTAAAHGGGRAFVTVLSGQHEVPAGDPNGIGVAAMSVNPGKGRVCYLLSVARLTGEVTAAHIHVAPAGQNGPVVVPLTAPTGGFSADCATVDRAVAMAIVRAPANYYVNVHTTEFPGGAVRGQLR